MFRTILSSLMVCSGMVVVPASQALAQDSHEQVSRGIEATLLDLGARQALGTTGKPLTISKPAQVRYELGAVVDALSPGNGLTVLAVSPDGSAEQMGLKPDDRLLAINGTPLTGVADASAILEKAMQDSQGQVRLQVARDERTLRLSGATAVSAIPAYQMTIGGASADGCGYVSDDLGVPPRSQYLYSALITRIDGRSTPLTRRPNRYRLEAGRHVLVIAERIRDIHRIGRSQRVQMSLARRTATADELYKSLVVDVKPGYSYRIGTKLLEDRLDNDSIRAHEYWKPVVYGKVAVECE